MNVPLIPAWCIVLAALLSLLCELYERRLDSALPRLYVAVAFLIIQFDVFGPSVITDYVSISRWGFMLIFIADIIPVVVKITHKMDKKYGP